MITAAALGGAVAGGSATPAAGVVDGSVAEIVVDGSGGSVDELATSAMWATALAPSARDRRATNERPTSDGAAGEVGDATAGAASTARWLRRRLRLRSTAYGGRRA